MTVARKLDQNGMKVASIERCEGFVARESSVGDNPRSVTGMKQGREGLGGIKPS